MPTHDKHRQFHPVYGEMKITSLALPTAWRPYLTRVNRKGMAGAVRKCIADHATIADMLRRDVPAEDLRRAMLELFAPILSPQKPTAPVVDRYGIHKPRPSGKPRVLHPAQVVKAPDAVALTPYAQQYAAQALDAVTAAIQRDPASTSAEYALPNRAQEAPSVAELLPAALTPLGIDCSPMQRRRGTREPYVTLTWQPGWTPPSDSPTSSEPDER